MNLLTTNFITNTISGFGLNDLLDIAIISYITYKILVWMRDTRTWSLLKGFILIVLLFLVALVFNLNTLKWIIENTFSVGIIAIFVLFQPEIRKALEQIGNGRIKNLIFDDTDETKTGVSANIIKETVKAICNMSKTKTGALILLENEVALGDLVKTGVAIDAVVSTQLIENIFVNKTPLHDGAMIIRSNRIASASCILPLTQDNLSQELGTRHRAAVGASEVSDAYVIVVSEETGGISIAHNGKLTRDLSDKELYDTLLSDLKPKRRLRVFKKG